MTLRRKNFYIITGGPGVGKTKLLNELVKYKFKMVPENFDEISKEMNVGYLECVYRRI